MKDFDFRSFGIDSVHFSNDNISDFDFSNRIGLLVDEKHTIFSVESTHNCGYYTVSCFDHSTAKAIIVILQNRRAWHDECSHICGRCHFASRSYR
jgi:hypothetical protein